MSSRHLRGIMLAALLLVPSVQAAASGPALLAPTHFVSTDSEDFVVRKTGMGVAPRYRDGNDYTALRLAHHRYTLSDWSIEARQLDVTRRAIDAHSGLGYQAVLGLNDLGDRQLLTADGDYGTDWGTSTRTGLYLNRDWVETRAALADGVYATHYGASLEQRLALGWSAIGLLGQQRFSDGNVRDHARLRLVYDLLAQWGVNAQFRHRRFWNSAPWGGRYFSPDVYHEDLLAVGVRRRHAGWLLAGALGTGQQRVSADAPTTTHLAELELSSPLDGNIVLRARAGYSDSAALTGPGYIYRYLQAELLLRF